MSRCFPFPPPGYEKKARIDDADLLKKEKHREKKHKKEKKDKDKREDKDRKEKDKSDGKRRDKKDRKEKSKEKKKDREREKDRDKTSTSQEKIISAQVESYNGDKLKHKEKERDKVHNVTSNEKKQNVQFHGHIGENSPLDEGAMDKFVLDLCSRIKDDEKGYATQSVESVPFTGRTNHDRMDGVVVKNETGIVFMEKEKKKDRKIDVRKIDGQGVRGDATASGSTVVQNIAWKGKNENKGVNIGGGFQNRDEGMPRTSEKNIEGKMEEREKIQKKESDDKQGNKRKEKKSHGKDKEREKEKKKEEKVKERSEQKIKDQDKVKDSIKNGHVVSQNIKVLPISQDGDRNTAVEGNLKKRKDIEANGFLHETHLVPNKKPRPNPHPSTENGRKLELCQTPVLHTPDMKGPPNNLKVNNNEHKINGTIDVQPLSISSKKSSSSKTKADQITQASTKPPHPDTKYLNQVLSVPKIEEWCSFDDQDWIFSSKGCVSGSPVYTEVSKTPRVWAEAVQIDSADVCALPYVIPY